ncbi:MAG: hypothetical protein LBT55_06020 [Clostridiaceae bacterium]|jgi:threonine synthase|nr:hypothetical protein [Clostridiaceae bacterium]
MLNKRSQEVLNYIRSVSRDGKYKVIDADDIIGALSDALTPAELSQTVKDLQERDYVIVKYATLADYCVAPSNKAIIEEEKQIAAAKKVLEETAAVSIKPLSEALTPDTVTSPAPLDLKKTVVYAAFFGGVIGSALTGIIHIIIALFT